jgi:hypothetical protein
MSFGLSSIIDLEENQASENSNSNDPVALGGRAINLCRVKKQSEGKSEAMPWYREPRTDPSLHHHHVREPDWKARDKFVPERRSACPHHICSGISEPSPVNKSMNPSPLTRVSRGDKWPIPSGQFGNTCLAANSAPGAMRSIHHFTSSSCTMISSLLFSATRDRLHCYYYYIYTQSSFAASPPVTI